MSPHGTDNRYKAGCRCDDCRVARREYERARRAKALEFGDLTHGKRATYDAGCRCDHCYGARQVAYYTREASAAKMRPGTGRRVTC